MTEFRNQIRVVISEELDNVEAQFSRLGLVARYNGMEPRSYGSDEQAATEVSISIHHGNNLVDRLEFFIEREGKPTASVDQVREWLQNELHDVIADFPHGGGWERV